MRAAAAATGAVARPLLLHRLRRPEEVPLRLPGLRPHLHDAGQPAHAPEDAHRRLPLQVRLRELRQGIPLFLQGSDFVAAMHEQKGNPMAQYKPAIKTFKDQI